MSGLVREYYVQQQSVRTGLNRKQKNELIDRKHELEKLVDIKKHSLVVYRFIAETNLKQYELVRKETQGYSDELREVREKLAGLPVEPKPHYDHPGRPRKK